MDIQPRYRGITIHTEIIGLSMISWVFIHAKLTEIAFFDVFVQGLKISLQAYIVRSLIGIDLILGSDVLSELGGNLDFESKIVKLKDKRVPLTPVRKYVINPVSAHMLF